MADKIYGVDPPAEFRIMIPDGVTKEQFADLQELSGEISYKQAKALIDGTAVIVPVEPTEEFCKIAQEKGAEMGFFVGDMVSERYALWIKAMTKEDKK